MFIVTYVILRWIRVISPLNNILKQVQTYYQIILIMKKGVFWDVTPCGSCKNLRFGGTWHLLHQGDKNRWTRNNTSCNQQPTYAAKKYQVRKEARMEFRIVDTVRLGGGDSSWVLNGLRQSEVPGFGRRVVGKCKQAMNGELCCQVSLGHVPKILRSRWEASMIYWGIPEDTFLHSHHCENLKSYISW
jgi:hypothetical protein